MRLDCRVVELRDGNWQATFEGECGRPYKYTIQMLGRQAGDVVLFSGSADLGEKDGGVYDWIGRGRAKAEKFIGFYTSQKYTSHFRISVWHAPNKRLTYDANCESGILRIEPRRSMTR